MSQSNRKSRLIFGADGGGTKTIGILAEGIGREIARESGGPSNPNVAGVERAAETLVDLLIHSCRSAGCTLDEIGSIVFGLAGVGSRPIREALEHAFSEVCAARGIPPLPVTLETDATIALEGAFGGGAGIIIIAGTGSVVLAKMPDGARRLIGGWGRVLGDEGSGYFLGLEALKAVARELEDRGSSGPLRAVCAERFSLGTREQLIAAVYKEDFAVPSLAPIVLDAAAAGDPVSTAILESAADFLADHLTPLFAAWPAETKIGIVLLGGLIDHETIYTRILREKILARWSLAEILAPKYPPVAGALILAEQKLDVR